MDLAEYAQRSQDGIEVRSRRIAHLVQERKHTTPVATSVSILTIFCCTQFCCTLGTVMEHPPMGCVARNRVVADAGAAKRKVATHEGPNEKR